MPPPPPPPPPPPQAPPPPPPPAFDASSASSGASLSGDSRSDLLSALSSGGGAEMLKEKASAKLVNRLQRCADLSPDPETVQKALRSMAIVLEGQVDAELLVSRGTEGVVELVVRNDDLSAFDKQKALNAFCGAIERETAPEAQDGDILSQIRGLEKNRKPKPAGVKIQKRSDEEKTFLKAEEAVNLGMPGASERLAEAREAWREKLGWADLPELVGNTEAAVENELKDWGEEQLQKLRELPRKIATEAEQLGKALLQRRRAEEEARRQREARERALRERKQASYNRLIAQLSNELRKIPTSDPDAALRRAATLRAQLREQEDPLLDDEEFRRLQGEITAFEQTMRSAKEAPPLVAPSSPSGSGAGASSAGLGGAGGGLTREEMRELFREEREAIEASIRQNWDKQLETLRKDMDRSEDRLQRAEEESAEARADAKRARDELKELAAIREVLKSNVEISREERRRAEKKLENVRKDLEEEITALEERAATAEAIRAVLMDDVGELEARIAAELAEKERFEEQIRRLVGVIGHSARNLCDMKTVSPNRPGPQVADRLLITQVMLSSIEGLSGEAAKEVKLLVESIGRALQEWEKADPKRANVEPLVRVLERACRKLQQHHEDVDVDNIATFLSQLPASRRFKWGKVLRNAAAVVGGATLLGLGAFGASNIVDSDSAVVDYASAPGTHPIVDPAVVQAISQTEDRMAVEAGALLPAELQGPMPLKEPMYDTNPEKRVDRAGGRLGGDPKVMRNLQTKQAKLIQEAVDQANARINDLEVQILDARDAEHIEELKDELEEAREVRDDWQTKLERSSGWLDWLWKVAQRR